MAEQVVAHIPAHTHFYLYGVLCVDNIEIQLNQCQCKKCRHKQPYAVQSSGFDKIGDCKAGHHGENGIKDTGAHCRKQQHIHMLFIRNHIFVNAFPFIQIKTVGQSVFIVSVHYPCASCFVCSIISDWIFTISL